MRPKMFVALAMLAVVAVACGTTLSDEEAKTDLGRDGVVAAGAGSGSSGGAAVGDSGGDVSSGGGDISTGGDTATGGETASSGGTATGGATSSGGAPSGGGTNAAATQSTGGATDVGVTADTINLGWVGTLTGPVPGIFRGALVGTQAYINYQNSIGGVMGRRLKLIPGDDSLDSGKNRAAHLALKDKVFSFVGSFSINDDGGAPVVTDCNCPDISGNLSKAMHDSPVHFGPQPAPLGWRSGPPKYYAQKYGKEVIEKLAFFYSNVGAAVPIANEMKRVYQEAGFKIAYERGVGPNDSQQTADVIQMQRAGVRAIAFQADLDTAGRLIKAMKDQNFKVDLLNLGNTIYDKNTFKVIQPDWVENLFIDQVYGMFLGEDAGLIPEINLFNEWMRKTDPNQTVDLFAMYGWLSGRLFTDSMATMAKAGKVPKRTDLLATLKGTGTWDGHGMVAPVDIGRKRASDCFFIFAATREGKWQRTFPSSGKWACDVGPFSYKP
jgi:ABC-type branched-subunit amino acid transport system substrate-binding protein